MTDNHFINIFDARFDYLWGLFQATIKINHRGEKGSLRETFVRQIIESLLPSHFGLGSGIVTDSNGRQSSQADIIIYDKRLLPPIFQDLGRGIYPIDSVMRVLEVKSVLDGKALHEVRGAAWKLHPQNPQGLKIARPGNLPDGHANYPLFGIFAYECKISDLSKAITNLAEFNRQPMMAVLGKGVCLKGTNTVVRFERNSELTRYFMSTYLHFIEEEAASRSNFGLLEWLGRGFRTSPIEIK